MSKYKPDMSDMIPMLLLVPTTTMVSGVAKKTFDVEHGILFFVVRSRHQIRLPR